MCPIHCLYVHSCSLNAYTKVLMNGNSSKSRVSVQIFSMVNLNLIYLHCQVQICVKTASSTCSIVSTLHKNNLMQLRYILEVSIV